MAIEDIKCFHNDDPGYEEWVSRHGAYVLTVRAKDVFMLHESECTHLGGFADPDVRLTKKPRRCGSKQDLTAWAVEQTGSKPLYCQATGVRSCIATWPEASTRKMCDCKT